MHTMNRVLDRHGRHQHHPRQDRLPAIAVVEGTKANGEHRAAGQQENLKRKQAFEGTDAAICQECGKQPHGNHHRAKDGQCKELRYGARGAKRKGCAKRDEIAGDVRGKKALQGKEPCRVDIACVQAQKQWKRRTRLQGRHL